MQHCVCPAPLPLTFEFVDDAERLPLWVVGVSEFVHDGGPAKGVGSQWRMRISFGPLRKVIDLECEQWERDEVIVMRSIGERELRLEFRFGFVTEAESAVDIVVGYPDAERATERALASRLEPVATIAMGRIAARLRDCVAAEHARIAANEQPE